MLQVYHSNRLELLLEIMCAQRASQPLADVFQADQILVANPGIGRWLSLQLSQRDGIAANIDYPLPASYVWKLYREHLDGVPQHSAFNKPRLQWTLMQLLADLPADDIYDPLRHYLTADSPDQATLKRVQLAAKIADVFDQYLVYRPNWLLDWEAGKLPTTAPGNWQAALWRALRARLDEPHRATLHRAFCDAASAGQLHSDKLPERLYIFNVVSLPPSYLDVLVALAEHVPIDLYLLNPSVEYWDGITDRKRQLKLQQKQGSDTPLDDGNALLAATGKLGQDALKLLHARGQFIHEDNFSIPAEQSGRLAQLQREVLTLTQPSAESAAEQPGQMGLSLEQDDHSLQVHSAHSVLREVQVLHDQLLARFERLPDLGPADIVVMVPNVDQYTPAVTAVFGSAPSERYIPWEIADRSLSQTDPVVALLRSLLDLPASEFTASEVLGWLSQPVLAARFELQDAEQQHLLSQWVRESGACRQLGASPLAADSNGPLNSWAFALRRLLAGYAMGDANPVGGVYPSAALEGGQAVLLGNLIDCLDRLGHWAQVLAAPRPMRAWLDTFNQLVSDLLAPDDDQALGVQQLRDCLAGLAENAEAADFDESLEPSAMLALLDNALAGLSAKTQRFLTGRVTISSMVPLRSVPFRVVCLLGLNDGEFPRQNKPVSFDLIAASPEIGDRSVREDDHYLFLEALLSARDELYLSWIGRSPLDNSEQTPSVLLAELMDYFRIDSSSENHAEGEALTVIQHPLQAFSPRYFNGSDPALFSYAAQWLPRDGIVRESLEQPAVAPGALSLSALIRFWRDPATAYCRDVLQLGLTFTQRVAVDTEPFDLDALERYQQRNDLLAGELSEPPLPPAQALAAAIGRGELPHGQFAQVVFDSALEEVLPLAERIKRYTQQPLPPAALQLHINGWHIEGQLGDLYDCGDKTVLIMARPGAFKGPDLISLSLSHLIGCAAGLLHSDSRFIARDKNHSMRHLSADDAAELLQPWLDHYAQGQGEALPFFPHSSLALLASPHKLEQQWLGGEMVSADSARESVQLLWPQLDSPLLLPAFETLAQTLLSPVLELLSEEKS